MECQRCPFFPFVKGISKYKIPDSLEKFKDKKYKSIGEKLRSVLGEACCYCSQHADDNNPSNHGQTFVSLDDDENVGGEHNDAKQDFIISNAKHGFGKSSVGADPYECVAEKDELEYLKKNDKQEYRRRLAAAREVSYTHIPASVEQVLKKEIMDFASLEIQDMMLLCCCLKGITISEFSTMRWFPRGMLYKNSTTLKPVTKQASHARFMNVIRKFPTFKSVARYLRPDSVDKGGGYRGKKRGLQTNNQTPSEQDYTQQPSSRSSSDSTSKAKTIRNPSPSKRTTTSARQRTAAASKHPSNKHSSSKPSRQRRSRPSRENCAVQGDLFLS